MIVDALRLSLLVTVSATLLVAVLGTLAGRWISTRRHLPGRSLLDGLLSLPLLLPPTVTGYYLLVLFGRRGVVGGPLYEHAGMSLAFNFTACVIAAAVMSFPLMYRSARVAFEELDPRQELAAASLGRRPWSVFWRVALPLARRGLAAGVILSFARALGEFGATLMLAGNIPGRTQTLPLGIYQAVVTGQDSRASVAVLLLTGVSLTVVMLAARLGGTQR